LTEELVRVDHLVKHFPVFSTGILLKKKVGEVHAVDDVSLVIGKGETVGLVGESGCGKTTTGRCVLRLYQPTSGTILFDGTDISTVPESKIKPFRKNMGVIFQDPFGSLNPRMTVRSIIEEGLIIHRLGDRRERLERVDEVLRQVGLDPGCRDRYPHEFSGGQRQRIGVARALVLRPRFMVLDEPLSALDVSIQSQIINLLIELREKFSLAYLFISHDLSVVEYVSDRVAVMYLGELVEMASSAELYARPLHPYTKVLMASIPLLDPTTRRKRTVLAGDIPSALHPPPGCRFHTRCPLAMEICRRQSPAALDLSGHYVRCHAVAAEQKKD